jgi:hypothetical protein
MGLILIFLAVGFVGVLLLRDYEEISIPFLLIGLIGVICIAILPFYRIGVESEISQFKAVVVSLESSDGEIESAAVRIEAVKANSWLADRQYYNNTFLFDWFIPDEVDSLTPISLSSKP